MEVVNRLEIANWQRSGGPEDRYPAQWYIPGHEPEAKADDRRSLTAKQIRELTNAQYQTA